MNKYRLMPWAEALATFRPDWLVMGHELGLNPTLFPDWTSIIIESLMDPAEVRVLVGTDGSKLLSLMPFQLRQSRISRIPVCILEPASSVMSYHAQIVSREDPEGLLRALLQTRDQLRWDLVRLGGVLVDSPTEQAIVRVAREEGLGLIHWPGEESPFLSIKGCAETLVASRDKRDRYLIRKHAKDFAATPGAVERWYEQDSDVEELLGAMLYVESRSWKQAAGIAISGDARQMRYFRRLLPWLATTGRLVALVLLINDEPVAYCMGYGWKGAFGFIKGTYHEGFSRLAVGHHAQDQLLFRLADSGGHEFDFLGDADPYKLAWSKTTRRHSDYFLYSQRGRGRWLGLAQRIRGRVRKTRSTGK